MVKVFYLDARGPETPKVLVELLLEKADLCRAAFLFSKVVPEAFPFLINT